MSSSFMQKIVTSPWFDTQAEKTLNIYCPIFPDSRIPNVARYGSAGPREEGLVMPIDVQLGPLTHQPVNLG